MKIIQQPIKTLVGAAVVALMSSQLAHAGAFSLYTEASGAAIGNYAAGIAAEAADASTAWYNPAGLVLLKKQEFVASGVGVFPSSKLTGTSTFVALPLPAYRQSFSELQAAENAFVPAVHYALPLGDSAAFGLSIVSPFGLSTNYSESSPVRYAATATKLRTIDVSPDIAGKITENISFGLGLDMQYAKVTFNAMLGIPGLPFANPAVTPTTMDSSSVNKGNSFGVGFHSGLMGMFNDNHTRVGVNYQSKMSHKFRGTSTLTGRLASPLQASPTAVFSDNDTLYSNNIDLPDVLTLSAYQDVNAKFALLGSVVYTGWSSFKDIQLNNVAAFSSSDGRVLATSIATENYQDAWRASIGANYRVTDQWMMRVGGGYDETPTVDSARDVRLPDSSRWALSIGTHYQFRPNLGVDVGYTHLFTTNDAVINKTQAFSATSSYNVNATAKAHVDLVGAQLVWSMDEVAAKSLEK